MPLQDNACWYDITHIILIVNCNDDESVAFVFMRKYKLLLQSYNLFMLIFCRNFKHLYKYFYFILPVYYFKALPEAPSNCEIDNELLSCEPGHDGGLAQKFLLEALEVRPRESAMDNEISTLNDQVSAASRACYRLHYFSHARFFMLRLTSISNA